MSVVGTPSVPVINDRGIFLSSLYFVGGGGVLLLNSASSGLCEIRIHELESLPV